MSNQAKPNRTPHKPAHKSLTKGTQRPEEILVDARPYKKTKRIINLYKAITNQIWFKKKMVMMWDFAFVAMPFNF